MTKKYKLKVPKLLKTWPYKIGYALAVVLIIFGTLYFKGGHSKAITDTFSASGTWNVPTNVFSATFEAWGGGGAGGGTSSNSSGGSGGAGGQYAVKNNLTVSPGDAYTVAVATIVAGGTGAGSVGNDSQVTNPSSTVFLRAKGGAGGGANTAAAGTGSTTNGIGDSVGAGGNGAVGTAALGGGGGGGAGSTGGGGNASGTTAGTGTSTNGGNGGTGVTTSLVGNPGNNYGGGGSGAFKTSGGGKAGGGGAQGFVTVTYTVTPPTYTQADYRLFANADSTTPGSALAAQDTGATLTSTGQQFRLRQLIRSNVSNSAQSKAASTNIGIDANTDGVSMAMGQDGFPRMIYSNGTNIHFIKCTNPTCSTNSVTNISAANDEWAQIAIASDGFARIAYWNTTNVVYLKCNDAACSAPSSNIVAASSNPRLSLALGTDDNARVAFGSSTTMKLAKCTTSDCSTGTTVSTIETNASGLGTFTSLVIGSDGNPRITYDTDAATGALRFAECTTSDCSSGTAINTVDSASGSMGFGTSLALDSSNIASIIYEDGSSNLKFAHCANVACSSGTSLNTIGSSNGNANSIAINSHGLAGFTYYDAVNINQYYVGCLNSSCSSFSSININPGTNINYVNLLMKSDDSYQIIEQGAANNSINFIYPNINFKLQFGSQGGACSSASYSDVTTASVIAFKDNATPADGDAITYATPPDPTDTGQSSTGETYQESGNFINPVSFGGTVDGEWDFSLIDNGASAGTTYCFRVVGYDGTTSTPFTTYANYPTITTNTSNSAPAAPTLSTPASGATGVSPNTQFTLRTTDLENDFLDYRLYIYQSDCSTAVSGSPFTQLSLQAGWTGQDANSGAAYVGSSTLASSTIATYRVQTPLSYNTTYCWKADATDPAGTNTYSSASGTQLFTTLTSSPTIIHGNVNIRGNTTIH